MDVILLLPFLRGWTSPPIIVSNKSFKAGEEVVLFESDKKGWFLGAFFSYQGSPDSKMILEYYDASGVKQTLMTSAKDLYGGEVVSLLPLMGATLVKWDSANNIYAVLYQPPFPIPICADGDKKARFVFYPTSDGKVINFASIVIQVQNENLFVGDLVSLLGGEIVEAHL